MDFTINRYIDLLKFLKNKNYDFVSLNKYIKSDFDSKKICIMRHDVDLNPLNSLRIAEIEKKFNIVGSYYFRITKNSYDLEIMKKINTLGHEIGYHYEDVDLVVKKNKSLEESQIIDLAYESFCKNLSKFRKHFNIETICMHGSPLSRYDNRLIWKKYNYKELDLLAEPYFDIDFSSFLYLTDTGRMWNGEKFSIRDKVDSKYNCNFKSTNDIINCSQELPKKIMFTIHPQRWHDKIYLWTLEFLMQKIKNQIKRVLI